MSFLRSHELSEKKSHFKLKSIKALPNFVLTNESKQAWELGAEGQGYTFTVELRTGKIHLIPAFNKDDGKSREDKNGKEFKTYVVSTQPRGALTGDLHTQSVGRLSLGEMGGIKGLLLGGGIWKKSNSSILEVRNRSTSQNLFAIQYDEVFLEYFKHRHESHVAHSINIKREIPFPIFEKIIHAIHVGLKIPIPDPLIDAPYIPDGADGIKLHLNVELEWLTDPIACHHYLLQSLLAEAYNTETVNLPIFIRVYETILSTLYSFEDIPPDFLPTLKSFLIFAIQTNHFPLLNYLLNQKNDSLMHGRRIVIDNVKTQLNLLEKYMIKNFDALVKTDDLKGMKQWIELFSSLTLKVDHLSRALSIAAEAGSFKTLTFLLTQYPPLLKTNILANIFWQTLRLGNLNSLKFLLEKDESLIELQNSLGQSPLIYAAKSGKIDIVSYLLEKGAKPKDYRACLIEATFDLVEEESFADIARILAENKEIDLSTKFNAETLQHAILEQIITNTDPVECLCALLTTLPLSFEGALFDDGVVTSLQYYFQKLIDESNIDALNKIALLNQKNPAILTKALLNEAFKTALAKLDVDVILWLKKAGVALGISKPALNVMLFSLVSQNKFFQLCTYLNAADDDPTFLLGLKDENNISLETRIKDAFNVENFKYFDDFCHLHENYRQIIFNSEPLLEKIRAALLEKISSNDVVLFAEIQMFVPAELFKTKILDHKYDVPLLNEAAKHGHLEMIEYLEKIGLNKNEKFDDCLFTGFNRLLEKHASESQIIAFLRKYHLVLAPFIALYANQGFFIKAQNQLATFFISYAKHGQLENIIQLRALLPKTVFSNLLFSRDLSGHTALHWAAYIGHTAIIKELSHESAALAFTSLNYKTPLDLAVEKNHIGCVRELLKADTKKILALDSALEWAVYYLNLDMVSLLLDHGASKTVYLARLQDALLASFEDHDLVKAGCIFEATKPSFSFESTLEHLSIHNHFKQCIYNMIDARDLTSLYKFKLYYPDLFHASVTLDSTFTIFLRNKFATFLAGFDIKSIELLEKIYPPEIWLFNADLEEDETVCDAIKVFFRANFIKSLEQITYCRDMLSPEMVDFMQQLVFKDEIYLRALGIYLSGLVLDPTGNLLRQFKANFRVPDEMFYNKFLHSPRYSGKTVLEELISESRGESLIVLRQWEEQSFLIQNKKDCMLLVLHLEKEEWGQSERYLALQALKIRIQSAESANLLEKTIQDFRSLDDCIKRFKEKGARGEFAVAYRAYCNEKNSIGCIIDALKKSIKKSGLFDRCTLTQSHSKESVFKKLLV